MTTHEKILKARTLLMWEQPFFGTLALRLNLEEDNRFPTAAVNTKTIFYNSMFIESLTMAETIGVLAHEVMHVALGHPWRQDWRVHTPWNIATDYTINENLIKAGFKLPKGCLVDNSYNDLSAEEIYGRLPAESEDDDASSDEQDDQTDDGDASKDSGTGSGDEDASDDDDDDDNASGDDENASDDNDDEDDEDTSGDGASNDDEDDVDEVDDPGGCGGVLKDDADDDDEDNSEAEWNVAVSQAAQVSKGTMNGDIKRQIEEHLNPSIDWAVLLRDFIEQTAKTDYSWNRPNTSYLQRGIYMPTLYSEELPEVCIVVDTSGSIDNLALAKFAKEASEILEAYNTTIRVIYSDDRVRGEEVFATEDLPMEMNPKGGGCTDFRPAFEYIEDNDYQPACMIYFTDLYGAFPTLEPDYPTLWLTQTKTRTAPFGETVLFE